MTENYLPPMSDIDIIESCINLIEGFPEKANILSEILLHFLDQEPEFVAQDIYHELYVIVNSERRK